MPSDKEPEEFIEEDEQDEIARRSIFSAGWFRALLVLTVLAIVVVVSLPYLLNWLEPTPGPPIRPQPKVTEQAPPPPSTPSPPSSPTETKPSTPPAAPAPTAPAPATKSEGPPAPPAAPAQPEPPKTAQATPAVPAPSAPAAKTAPAAKAESKASATRSIPAESGSSGGYWVQVGAFVEEKNAEALSKQLKSENFPVTISRISRGGGTPAPAAAPASPDGSGGQNQLFITGSTADAVNAALKGKGTAQAVKGGLVVNPSYDLETAMSLSSALKKEGFKVVIRRAKAAAAPAAAPSSGGGGTIYHVVRVGGYPDRAKALQVRSELDAKGHPGFLAQGAAR